jgi:3-hydroxyisobutyrate dehydrogenase-like beta-hydroxyacid dehydrogenase
VGRAVVEKAGISQVRHDTTLSHSAAARQSLSRQTPRIPKGSLKPHL